MKRSRFSDEQIVGILKEHQAGLGAKELCRKQGHGNHQIWPEALKSLYIRAQPQRRLQSNRSQTWPSGSRRVEVLVTAEKEGQCSARLLSGGLLSAKTEARRRLSNP